jgi:gluconate kinase
MRKRDPQLVLEAIESDRDERATLGYNAVICRALKRKCRECVRFNCRKRTEKWKYDITGSRK